MLRCLDRNCPLRTLQEQQVLEMAECKPEKPQPNSEIDEGHAGAAAIDFGEEEDAGPEETIIVNPETDRSCIRDLWPFAYGKEYYKK